MKHSHYTKNISHLSAIDVYRVLSLFGVTDQAIGHAIKKLLCPGQRGVKTKRQDIQEAIDTLERWKAMEDEDSTNLYSAEQHPVKTDHVALVDVAPNPNCKVVEPAAAIDDESPRMQAIGQNGNDGLHYPPNIHPKQPMAGDRVYVFGCEAVAPDGGLGTIVKVGVMGAEHLSIVDLDSIGRIYAETAKLKFAARIERP